MTYQINSKQYENVLSLNSSDRSEHFISKVADWEKLWGMKSEGGWLFPQTESGVQYLPVWPHPEYAQKVTDRIFKQYIATEISLDNFITKWLPGLIQDDIKVGVFPNKDWSIWLMEPSALIELLREEIEQYE